MILHHIHTSECPHCGCSEVISEAVEVSRICENEVRTHCNGQRWETRVFLCRTTVKWLPNFEREICSQEQHCEHGAVYQARQQRRKELREQIDLLERELRDL